MTRLRSSTFENRNSSILGTIQENIIYMQLMDKPFPLPDANRTKISINPIDNAVQQLKFGSREQSVRIGVDFQAEIPYPSKINEEFIDSSLLLWSPVSEDKVTESRVTKYVENAKVYQNFSEEQALGILMKFNYDIAEAEAAINKFTTIETEKWTPEDERRYKKAYKIFKKDFQKIHSKMLPHKSIPSLVSYYYESKRLRRNWISSSNRKKSKKIASNDRIDKPVPL